ncbi:hypothetical protein A6R68_10982 [Neotoma lepida]|uniref:Cyclin-like domain-containing protein n=1 Tax=Neotoma lepida TaxID=56216 RepID=A0A1A6FWE4_NEOLE|nr:hypothetical protein A6R68_10982 [Neotoma lepida]
MELTCDMRAFLVDWLVEIQGSLQMNHETLHLTVKLMDHYLMKAQCERGHLQLLGSTLLMIAAKFEESYPPSLPEFLYVCEDVFQKHDMVFLERNILNTLNFDISIPTAYNFLRRYASIPLLEHYTGYKIAELHTLVRKINNSLLFQRSGGFKNVYEKYSEEAFFEVSKIPPLDKDNLEEILKCAN